MTYMGHMINDVFDFTFTVCSKKGSGSVHFIGNKMKPFHNFLISYLDGFRHHVFVSVTYDCKW